MIGKTISHYKILEELGRGGMGEVYLAEDTKLHRKVALKFLPSEFTRDAYAKERFMHEARAASKLDHPNICTVHEIDETEDGCTFICMTYYEGEPLREKLERGPLGLEEAIDTAMLIGAGLSRAHESSITHRDIKPANIMVTERGEVKIVDFGLAKLGGITKLTKEGTTLGTVEYMSPEQARGAEVDHRTDIWSLGVVLYQMIVGRPPFKHEYEQAVMYAIMNDEPKPLTALRTGVPPELERIVTKCLKKDPAERYQTAADLIVDLRDIGRMVKEEATTSRSAVRPQPQKAPPSRGMRWLPWVAFIALAVILAIIVVPRYIIRTGEPTKKSTTAGVTMIVVLPFENLGPSDDEYFADGITDAINARLVGLSGLGVISRQSAIQYKGGGKSTREISDELGVDYILEGTVQRERPSDPNSRVRIIPQLIRCDDDIHLWADTYDEDMIEVFRLQSEIAERVARELDIALLEPERRALAAKPTENLEAYEYYLRGIEYKDIQEDSDASREVVRMFEKAVELDPNFAIAWAELSRAYTWLHWMFDEKGALANARAAVDEAMRIDPDLPEGHLALGFLYYHGNRDYERALEHFNIVQKQRPGDAHANSAIGFIKRRQGKWEEALQYFERAFKVNPRSYMTNWDNLGTTLIVMRRYDEAEKYIDRAMSLEAGMLGAQYSKAQIAILRDGDPELANSYIEKMNRHNSPGGRCPPFAHTDPSIFRIVQDAAGDRYGGANLVQCIPSSPLDTAVVMLIQAGRSVDNNEIQEAVMFLDSARVVLERNLQVKGQYYAGNFSALGFVYAYLQRKEDAIRTGERAVQLLPISKDAFTGTRLVHRLAEIYAIVGEHEAAIDQLEILCSVPSLVSGHALRLDPMWDPLRDNPRFQRLLDEYSENGS